MENAVMDPVTKVTTTAEAIKNDETQWFSEAASVGDAVRQGDIYITKLKAVPKEAKLMKVPAAQLAPGNTRGSRHILKSLEGVKMYSIGDSRNIYNGPIIEATQEIEIDHPEHGNWICPPGVYGVSYQRTVDSEGVQRRVAD
jgi:hypothetical protein